MSLIDKCTSLVRDIRTLSRLNSVADHLERIFFIQKETFIRDLLRSDERLADTRCLNRYEAQLFSQSGQDGILAEIFRRLNVEKGSFVEFGVGVGDGFETNTAALLLQGWSGLWIEAAPAACGKIKRNFSSMIAQRRLRLTQAFVTAENIASLLSAADIPTDLDLLSIDIDGNDAWAWRALTSVRPKCVIIEYNAYFPAGVDWVMPYSANHEWNGSIEFGASAKALERTGARLGYKLVACDTTGSDCFFVRDDLCDDRFAGPFTAEQWFHPMRYSLINRPGYPRRMRTPFSLDYAR